MEKGKRGWGTLLGRTALTDERDHRRCGLERHRCCRRDVADIKNALKSLLSLVIIVGVALFFYKSFQKNWTAIQSYIMNLNYLFLALSFVFVLLTYLLSTYGWQRALNSLSGNGRLTFSQSVAVFNASGLVKYIPGKVWSYALQMYWLTGAGFLKSVILYVNLINLFISIIVSLIVGLCYVLFSPGVFPASFILPLLLILVLFDILFIKFNAPVTYGMISLANRIFKRDIICFSLSRRLIIHLHVIHSMAAFCFGISAYLLCYGIGIEIGLGKVFLVMSALLLSDVIGFLVVVVPGGLGVRESVMYLMLINVSTVPLSLILPVATRIIGMLADMLLGIIAFVLLRYRMQIAKKI